MEAQPSSGALSLIVRGNQNPFELLRPVSKDAALMRWDYYGKTGD